MGCGLVTYIEILEPSLSLEQLKFQTSNLVCRLTTRSTRAEMGSKGARSKL